MKACEDLGLCHRTVRKYTDKYYGRYQSVTHFINDFESDDEEIEYGDLEDLDWDDVPDFEEMLEYQDTVINDTLPKIEHYKDGGHRLCFSVKICPKELTPQKRVDYEERISKKFSVPLMSLDGETYTLLFSANEAYAMLDGIKALKEDIRFIASTRSFIVYDRIEDIRYRIIE